MTIKEIAKLAGVSVSTVSKIVNKKDQNINQETRNRVLKIVKEYHYTPYSAARNNSRAKTFLLGVLLRRIDLKHQLLKGILEAAQQHGYNIMLFDSQDDNNTELKHITAICEKKLDGLIWEPLSQESLQHTHYLSEQDIPIVYINSPEHADSYQIDFRQMGYDLTQKLLEHRHNRIACLLKENNLRSELILEGFKRCLYDNQIPFENKMLLYVSDDNFMSLVMQRGITGVISSHFVSSLIFYERAEKFHYHIPNDLSLLTLKGDEKFTHSFPHISGLRIPYQEFGAYICQQLINQCEKIPSESAPLLYTAPNHLDCGDSLGIPPSLREKKIVVVGSINIDMNFNVDWLPQAGKTTRIHNSVTTIGGKGANQAVGAAKLGHEVILIGEVGNDADSAFVTELLVQEGVSTQGIHRNTHLQTGKAYIYIEKNGESAITIIEGANSSLTSDRINKCRRLFKNAGYCLISTEISVPTVLASAKIARQSGAQIILKPSTLKCIPEILFSMTDIFIPNRKEAAALCPDYNTVEEQAEFFFSKGIQIVIITLGKDGCYLKTADTAEYFPAADFVAIDTTGGADAFIAALASYLARGYSLKQSVRIATYAAGFCISRQGVVPSLIDKNTLESHIVRFEAELLQKNQIE